MCLTGLRIGMSMLRTYALIQDYLYSINSRRVVVAVVNSNVLVASRGLQTLQYMSISTSYFSYSS